MLKEDAQKRSEGRSEQVRGAEKSRAREASAFCLGVVLICALTELLGLAKGDRLVFPNVGEILSAFFRLLSSPRTYQQIGTTLLHLVISMAFSTVIGVTLGLLEGASDFARQVLKPLTVFLRSIPMIVLVVIVMVLANYERVPVIVSTLALIPLISEAANEGSRRIDREWKDVYRMDGRFGMRVLFKVHLPLMAGYLKQAYISAVGMGIRLAVSTEYLVQTKNSLGKAIYSSSYFNEYADIYAYALIMILLVLLVGEAPSAIARLLSSRRQSPS